MTFTPFLVFQCPHLFWALSAFILISGLSLFVTYNLSISIFRLSSLLGFYCLTWVFYILFTRAPSIFYYLSVIISLILLYQVLHALNQIDYKAFDKIAGQIGRYMRGNKGNVNIMVASILIKLPFLLYVINKTKNNFIKAGFILGVIPVVVSVIFINARVGLISFIVVILSYIIRQVLMISQDKSNKINTYITIGVAGAVILAIVSANLLKKQSDASGRFGGTSTIERLTQVKASESSFRARTIYWKGGLELIKKHPLLGVGLGNWAVEIIPYETKERPGHSLNAHNDFVEISTETGILNGILFLSIFAFIFYSNIKILFSSSFSTKQKEIAFTLLLIGAVYVFDASFNFPMYKTTMQLGLGVLIAASIWNNRKITEELPEEKNESAKSNKNILFVIVLAILTIGPIYINYQAYKTMKLAVALTLDPFTKDNSLTPKVSHENIENLNPKYPNIVLANVSPYEEFSGVILMKEKRYEEAEIQFLKSLEINPYADRANHNLYGLYNSQGKFDLAYDYLEKAYYLNPYFERIFIDYFRESLKRDNIDNAVKAYQAYARNQNQENILVAFVKELLEYGIAPEEIQTLLKEGNIRMYGNQLNTGIALAIGSYFETKNNDELTEKFYKQALEIDSTNVSSNFGLAKIYIKQRNYKSAIELLHKSLEGGSYSLLKNEGEIELMLGISYRQSSDMQKACEFLKISKDKGSKDGGNLYTAMCASKEKPKQESKPKETNVQVPSFLNLKKK